MVPMPGPLDPTGGDQWSNVGTNEPEPIFSDNKQNYKIMSSTFCSAMLANDSAQRNREILWKL